MASSTVIGHSAQQEDLRRDLEAGNVTHAYLFTGPEHIGKFTLAKWFAEELLLRGLSPEDEESVRHEVRKLLHPDLLVIDLLWREDISEDLDLIAHSSNIPQAHRIKAKAKTDTIGIDDIRAVQERLYEIPRSQFRCCLIRNIERLQTEGVNALLKILEEPPPGLVFLFTSSEPDTLLPTLLSRTRRLSFSRLTRKELRPFLEGLADEDAAFLLHLSQGAPGIIHRLRNDPEALRQEQLLAGTARTFWQEASTLTRLQLLTPLAERSEAADRFLLHLTLAARALPPSLHLRAAGALRRFFRGAKTNVSRPLLCQELALLAGKEP